MADAAVAGQGAEDPAMAGQEASAEPRIKLPVKVGTRKTRTRRNYPEAYLMQATATRPYVCGQSEKQSNAYMANITELRDLINGGRISTIRDARTWLLDRAASEGNQKQQAIVAGGQGSVAKSLFKS